MDKNQRHFEVLRPNRFLFQHERYEFAHGTNSICVYDINTMNFIKEIPIGKEPDCHAVSMNNRYLYIACIDGGLYCLDQESLEIVKVLDTGPVFSTNIMPDGSTMLLYDFYGGILVLKDIEDMDKIHIYKRLDIFGERNHSVTVGGKGSFIDHGRYYINNGWRKRNMYIIDLENDYSWDIFMENEPLLKNSDDLVVSRDKTRAYSACYETCMDGNYVLVTDIKSRSPIKKIRTGKGTCGLTMSDDEMFVIASNDKDDSISIIDTRIDDIAATVSARAGFERLGLRGFIQGITCGQNGEIFVYDCSGSGALVKFWDILGEGNWIVSYPGGKCSKEQ